MAESGNQTPPYPRIPSLHPVPTHPAFLPLEPDGFAPLPPGLSSAKPGTAPVIEGPQIQIVPPTADEDSAPARPKRTDRVTQRPVPRAPPDPDAQSWLFSADGLNSVNPGSLASHKSDRDSEIIRR
jgi:hypothetical protein